LILGIDLTDEYIAIAVQGDENASVFPAVICREKKDDIWYIGEEAYRVALAGQGVMTDKLLKLLEKDGTSTVYHRTYTAAELLGKLIAKVIGTRIRTADLSQVERVAVAVHKPDAGLMDRVMNSLEAAGIRREKATVITHEEAFVQYTLSREKEFYSSMVALFDLTGETLSYYEFMMIRGVSRRACVAEGEDLEEAFHTDILKKDSGRTLADKIMTDAARTRMEGKLFSAVFLTGSGFERTDWAQSFLNCICQKRRVVQESGLFAIGAQVLAGKLTDDGTKEDCLVFCNDRISSEISISVCVRERESRLVLVPAGERFYGLNVHVELIPQEQDYIDFQIEPFDVRKSKRTARAMLAGFPERPDRTTRVALDLDFRATDRADICMKDLGFGDLFPASDRKIIEEITL